MKKIEIVFSPEDYNTKVVSYPFGFSCEKYLGFELSSGERFMRINWSSSEGNCTFFYPFVGGRGITLLSTGPINSTKIRSMIAQGTFYSFDTAQELYEWMSKNKT